MGKIYMGKSTWLDMVFDTGNDWIVAEGATCTNCDGNTYNISENLTSGIAKQVSKQTITRSHGSAEMLGNEYTDSVCILP